MKIESDMQDIEGHPYQRFKVLKLEMLPEGEWDQSFLAALVDVTTRGGDVRVMPVDGLKGYTLVRRDPNAREIPAPADEESSSVPVIIFLVAVFSVGVATGLWAYRILYL